MNKLDVKVRNEVTQSGSIMHEIVIKNIYIDHLKKSQGKYVLECKKKNDRQVLEIKITIDKSLVSKKNNTKRSMTTIIFDNEYLQINIARLFSTKKIKKTKEFYIINYTFAEMNDVVINVTNSIKKEYFEKRFIPKIDKIKKQKSLKKQETKLNKKAGSNSISSYRDKKGKKFLKEFHGSLPKSIKIGGNNSRNNKRKMSPEELKSIDFRYSDQFSYNYSPNSDGLRSSKEFLGGSGSNMFRKKK